MTDKFSKNFARVVVLIALMYWTAHLIVWLWR